MKYKIGDKVLYHNIDNEVWEGTVVRITGDILTVQLSEDKWDTVAVHQYNSSLVSADWVEKI